MARPIHLLRALAVACAIGATSVSAAPIDHSGSDRPDVFGSVALPLGHAPLEAKWRQVDRAPVTGSASRFARLLRSESAFGRLEKVNRYVNHAVQFAADAQQFGRPDVWSTADETLRRGRGDCEDYAIAKLQMLRSAGFADKDLYLVLVRDLVRRDDHAVLVARVDGQFYLLDNGTDEVLETEAVRDYRPIVTFAASGAWTHGYRVRSRETEVEVAEAAAQRSRSASLLAFKTGFNR